MKHKITLLSLLFICSFSFAQISVTNNSINSAPSFGGTIIIGQSFKATQDGVIFKIQVVPDFTETSVLNIYSGEGFGGVLLHTQTVNLTDLYIDDLNYSFQTIVLNTYVPITNGNMYTFSFSNATSFGSFLGNSYIDGGCYVTGGNVPNIDLTFSVLQEPTPVPNTLTYISNNASASWFSASTWFPVRVPTSNDDVIIPNGKAVTIGASGAVAKNVIINNGSLLYISPSGTLTLTNNIQNDGSLLINSSSSNSGSLIVGSYSGVNTATYQRYLSGGDWHLLSTPLSTGGISIADFITAHGATMTTSGVKYSLAIYDNSFPADGTSTWKNYTSDGSNPAPATVFGEAKGYEILMNSPSLVDFTGRINNTPVSYQLTENVTGWNLIGNPFPSSVYGNSNAHATDNFLTQNSASLDPSYVSMYIWNPGSGSYDIVNQGTGSRSIPPGQAFFVKSKTGGATVNFEDNMRTHQSANNFQKGATTSIPTINLSIDNNVGTVRSTDVKYMSGATLGLDPGYDAGQFGAVGTSNFNLYTHLVQDNGVKFALQVVPDTDYDTTVIPIGIDANAGTQITFKATATDLPTDKKVFLEDKLLNKVTEINHTDKTYTVNLSTNLSGTGRFFLHTKANNTLAIDNYVASQYTLVTSPEQHNIRLYGAVAEKGSINIFDSFGRIIYTTTLQKGTEQDINVPIMSTGIYILKFNIDNKPFSKKIVWY